MGVDRCKTFNPPKMEEPRGNLAFIESSNQIPFDIQRVNYLYDVTGGGEYMRAITIVITQNS